MIEFDDAVLAVLKGLDSDVLAHSIRVQALAVALGKKIGLVSAELAQLRMGALLHDLGKKKIYSSILKKKKPLSAREKETFQLHPIFGWNEVVSLELDDAVKRMVLEHHLWADGKGGYPSCFENTQPSELTQILTVANVVDILTSAERSGRCALSLKTCLQYLERNAGTKFNSEIIELLKKWLSQKRLNSIYRGAVRKVV
ncbi:MAG: HD domain-containing protein [Firmicutes bacterium]|nr:HD domain-containing protein [Bacillota bacterium]